MVARAGITVVIPTYQRADTLQRALRSVLTQDGVPLRILVCDNASGDGTADAVRQFHDDRIQYHAHETNLGMAANFHWGLERVQTEYFVLLSDDDFLLPGFLRNAITVMEHERQAAFLAGACLQVSETGLIGGVSTESWGAGLHMPPAGVALLEKRNLTWTGILFREDCRSEVLARLDGPASGDLCAIIQIGLRMPFFIDHRLAACWTRHDRGRTQSRTTQDLWSDYLYVLGTAVGSRNITPAQRIRFWDAWCANIRKHALAHYPTHSAQDRRLRRSFAKQLRLLRPALWRRIRRIVEYMAPRIAERIMTQLRERRHRKYCAALGISESFVSDLQRELMGQPR